MDTKFIQSAICKHEVLKLNLPCENITLNWPFYGYEMDVLSVSKSGYLTEYEVKVSKSDFRADLKKRKWKWFELKIESSIPNYFYYVCPVGMISKVEIKDYQGLIYVSNEGEIDIVKKAKILHKTKPDIKKIVYKICRMMTERNYLGNCRLTYENKKIKSRHAELSRI